MKPLGSVWASSLPIQWFIAGWYLSSCSWKTKFHNLFRFWTEKILCMFWILMRTVNKMNELLYTEYNKSFRLLFLKSESLQKHAAIKCNLFSFPKSLKAFKSKKKIGKIKKCLRPKWILVRLRQCGTVWKFGQLSLNGCVADYMHKSY